jgi:signal transduction histidine kinase
MFRNVRLQSKMLLLVIGPLVGLLALGVFSLIGISRSASDLEVLQTREIKLYQAANDTRYLDEVLTHSAARYITSNGDEKWWIRYNDAVGQLDVALATGKQFATPNDLEFLSKVDIANQKLITLETEIHDLVKAGKGAEATKVLSGEYDVQKNIYSAGVKKFFDASTARISQVVRDGRDRADTQRNIVLIVGFLGLGLIAAALVFARRISGPLVALTAAANTAAKVTLPQMLIAAQAGDVEGTTLAQFDTGTADEMGELTRALDSFQNTAVGLAQEQTVIRRNMAETLVNLGRRNQGLLNKTLKLISNLERDERDPQRLDELFKLDHLATRVRRNAESLLVLAGANSSRVSPRPVAMNDVLRAAVSEIEDYNRVEVELDGHVHLRGSVVADVAHLLAELLENAATCSPPNEPVRVSGKMGINDYRIVIVDEGVGMSSEALEDANERVSSAPKFEARPTKALGLHVVGRLADRHGINVRLIENVTGGVAVKISIPLALTMDSVAPAPTPTPEPRVATTAPVDPRPAPAVERRMPPPRVAPVAPIAPVASASRAPEPQTAWATVTSLPTSPMLDNIEPETPVFEQRQRGAQRFESGRPTPAVNRPSASAEQVASRLGSFQNATRPGSPDESDAALSNHGEQ